MLCRLEEEAEARVEELVEGGDFDKKFSVYVHVVNVFQEMKGIFHRL